MTDSHPTPVLRSILLAGSLWLLGSWTINLYLAGGAHEPALKWTFQAGLLAIALLWPAWRLSQPCPAHPTLATLADWLAIIILFQVPFLGFTIDSSPRPLDLLFTAPWNNSLLHQIALLDLALIIHSLPFALFLDLGRRGHATRRTLAMLACSLTFIIPPILTAGSDPSVAALSSGIRAIWLLSDFLQPISPSTLVLPLGIIGAVIMFLWLAVVPFTGSSRNNPQQPQ